MNFRPSYILLIVIFIFIATGESSSQVDTLRHSVEGKKRVVSPMKATMLAAALPGAGQIYNRKYWKVPFVYAGFGALGYSIVLNTSSYNNFLQAYIDITDDVAETDSYLEVLPDYDPVTIDPALGSDLFDASASEWIKSQLLNGVDYYRRYRDLSYIGVAMWYLVTILDANIDSNMYDYDVSEDLNIKLHPVPIASMNGRTAGLAITLTF